MLETSQNIAILFKYLRDSRVKVFLVVTQIISEKSKVTVQEERNWGKWDRNRQEYKI